VAPFAGRFVKDADPLIIAELERTGSLQQVEPYTHSYPHCWRCGTPLVYYAKNSWFARTRSIRDELVAANETVSWYPAHIKHGRFGDWLSGNVDWALSRDRYWGTPIPVWRCDGPLHHDVCVGSVGELAGLASADLSDLDLHRPYIDGVVFPCPEPECGGTARRVEPVLDAWFDSGSMPSAQHHYPFDEPERFETAFPADFICEGIDQTRGWFYSLLAVNTAVFRKAPYRNVLCLAHVVDAEGQKMSKSKGNAVDPWSVLTAHGADALRWYFFSAGSPWTSRRFSREGIDEAARRFLVTLWNTYAFLVTYADLSEWSPAPPEQPGAAERPRHVLDRWLLSRLHSTIAAVTEALEDYDSLEGASALGALVDDVSNWYVRRSRARFWKDSDSSAHASLHECLLTVAKLLAPFCPFVADEIFVNLAGSEGSVHLEDWPVPASELVDPALEEEMALARKLVSLGRAARNEARVKVRQPLRRAFLLLGPDGSLGEAVLSEIAGELNVRRLELVEGLEGLISYTVVPNFRALGPRLGPLVGKVKAALGSVDGNEVRRSLEEQGSYRLAIDGQEIELSASDVEVRPGDNPGLALAQDGPYAVALDLSIDEDLRLEGLARELARALNEARKTAGLAIADRVSVTLRAPGELALAARRHGDWIAGEVLATSWQVDDWGADDVGGDQVLELDGARFGLVLSRAAPPRADPL
ncbi:MAG: class I tRNA ligase family protein, partial [Acidimicrobiia bacterium]